MGGPKTSDPVGALAERLGVAREEIAFLDRNEPGDVWRLVRAHERVVAADDEAVAEATDRALGFVPGPLRRRLLAGLR